MLLLGCIIIWILWGLLWAYILGIDFDKKDTPIGKSMVFGLLQGGMTFALVVLYNEYPIELGAVIFAGAIFIGVICIFAKVFFG